MLFPTATVPTIEDCTSRAQLMGEASLLGRLVPCLFFNVGQQESCCSAAHDLLGNDEDADMDLELCTYPTYIAHFPPGAPCLQVSQINAAC
jgi:hypothetical protein